MDNEIELIEKKIQIMTQFNFQNSIFNFTMIGTTKNPLFLANEVAAALGIVNFTTSLKKKFNEKDRIIVTKEELRETYGLPEKEIFGESKQRVLLTETGLYKMIFRSNKEIAEAFQEWVFEVIKKIRLEGQYVLNPHLNETVKHLEEKNKELQEELEKVHSEITWTREQGQVLYCFQLRNKEFKCGVCKFENLESRERNFKTGNPNGKVMYTVKVKDAFAEKIMHHIMKKKLIWIGGEVFSGEYESVKTIMDITCKFEALLASTDVTDLQIMNQGLTMLIDSENLEKIGCYDSIVNKEVIVPTVKVNLDPEITVVSKGKRPVDQIDKNTNVVVASYKTLEAAGNALGVTGNAIGIAVRNQKACKGYMWRYQGVSKEEQFSNQPVIKIQCSTGTKTHFKSLGEAAKDANISTAGLRNRVITHVHRDDHHWIWDVNATHYVTSNESLS